MTGNLLQCREAQHIFVVESFVFIKYLLKMLFSLKYLRVTINKVKKIEKVSHYPKKVCIFLTEVNFYGILMLTFLYFRNGNNSKNMVNSRNIHHIILQINKSS